MKKSLLVLSSVSLLALSLASCSKHDEEETSKPGESTTPTTTEEGHKHTEGYCDCGHIFLSYAPYEEIKNLLEQAFTLNVGKTELYNNIDSTTNERTIISLDSFEAHVFKEKKERKIDIAFNVVESLYDVIPSEVMSSTVKSERKANVRVSLGSENEKIGFYLNDFNDKVRFNNWYKPEELVDEVANLDESTISKEDLDKIKENGLVKTIKDVIVASSKDVTQAIKVLISEITIINNEYNHFYEIEAINEGLLLTPKFSSLNEVFNSYFGTNVEDISANDLVSALEDLVDYIKPMLDRRIKDLYYRYVGSSAYNKVIELIANNIEYIGDLQEIYNSSNSEFTKNDRIDVKITKDVYEYLYKEEGKEYVLPEGAKLTSDILKTYVNKIARDEDYYKKTLNELLTELLLPTDSERDIKDYFNKEIFGFMFSLRMTTNAVIDINFKLFKDAKCSLIDLIFALPSVLRKIDVIPSIDDPEFDTESYENIALYNKLSAIYSLVDEYIEQFKSETNMVEETKVELNEYLDTFAGYDDYTKVEVTRDFYAKYIFKYLLNSNEAESFITNLILDSKRLFDESIIKNEDGSVTIDDGYIKISKYNDAREAFTYGA